jgi:hypothetical protein
MSFSGKHPIGVTDSTAWPVLPTTGDEADNYMAGRLKTLEAGAGTGGFYFNRKTADSAMAATTALVDDADLQFPIGANEVWEADFVLDMTGTNTTGDIKLAVNVPAGATGRLSTMGLGGSATTATGSISASSTTDLTDTGLVGWYVSNALNTVGIARLIVVNGSTAGTVKLRRAQFTASGTTTLQTNSYVKATRVSPIQPAGANYGAMQLVKTETLAAAATSFVGVTGLDLNADYEYILVWGAKNATGSTNNMLLTYNGDTTAANYDSQATTSNGATPGAARTDTAKVAAMLANGEGSGEIKILKPPPSGNPRAHCVYSNGTGTGINDTKLSHVWTGTANVISLGFGGDQATGLAAGSWYALFRLAPVQMARPSDIAYAEVQGAAVTSFGVTGLNLDVDLRYNIEIELLGASGTPTLSMTFNADTTATNYDVQAFETSGGSSGGGRSNNANIFGAIVTDTTSIDGVLRINAEDRPRMLYEYSAGDAAAVKRGHGVLTWRTAGTNVTGFTVTSSVASAIGIGSFIRVRRTA